VASMSEVHLETVFWIFGIALFGFVALFPQIFFRILGRGKVVPPPSALLFLRILAGVCALGLVYRII
jgi:hypothetical protein